MKEKKMESMPIASRSRRQTELREKELREKNKRARLAARNEYWKKNAAKLRNPSLGGDCDKENVIVVDESAYLKRTSMVGGKDSSGNVDASFEGSSDDSVQIVGERWNPLGAGFDNNEDGDDFDGVACDFQHSPSKASSKGCADHGVDSLSLSMGVGSEDSCGASAGHCLSPSENDDKVSDEDFLVDEAEMRTVYSSESSQYYSAFASEKEGKWKGKASANKINERFLEEDIQSSDEFDEDYLQSLKCHYGSSSKQRENAEIVGSSVNGGKRKRGRPPKTRSPGFVYEAEDRAMSENYDCSKNGSSTQSSPLPYHSSSKNGATKKRGRPCKNRCEIIWSESESENDPIGVFAKYETAGNRETGRMPQSEESEDGDEHYLKWLRSLELSGRCGNAGNRKRGRLPTGMNLGVDSEPENELKPMDGYRKRGRPPKKTILVTESESENDLVGESGDDIEDIEDGDEGYMHWLRNLELSGRCDNGGKQKRGRTPKRVNEGVGSEPENDGHQQRGALPKNGGYGKRGRPPKNWNKGFDSERGHKRPRGRQAKNWNKAFGSDKGCKRSRGRPRKMSRI